jgi:hypothetical protein
MSAGAKFHLDGGAIYGLDMADRALTNDALVKYAAAITSRLGDKLDGITSSIQQLLVAEISELRGDEQLQQLLRDTVAGNIDAFFSAIRHGIPVERLEPRLPHSSTPGGWRSAKCPPTH